MNTKKINVLKKAVQMLENGFNYDWLNHERCNCGVVAYAAYGKLDGSIRDACNGSWSSVRNLSNDLNRCKLTGLCLGAVQEVLLQSGFTSSELFQLECLDNKAILNRANIDTSNHQYYAIKENLLKYLRSWVELLTEEMEQQRETARELLKDKPAIRYIAIKVDNSIFEQAKELIKN